MRLGGGQRVIRRLGQFHISAVTREKGRSASSEKKNPACKQLTLRGLARPRLPHQNQHLVILQRHEELLPVRVDRQLLPPLEYLLVLGQDPGPGGPVLGVGVRAVLLVEVRPEPSQRRPGPAVGPVAPPPAVVVPLLGVGADEVDLLLLEDEVVVVLLGAVGGAVAALLPLPAEPCSDKC